MFTKKNNKNNKLPMTGKVRKPDNIYVYDHRAYLFDFDTTQYYGRLKYCSYSEGWSAPEQEIISGQGYANNRLIGFHTDVYSIAAVAFYILTGKTPLDFAEGLATIAENVNWKDIIDLTDKDSALDDETFLKELRRIFSAALNPDAQEREQFYGDKKAAIKLKNEFLHLKSLAENAPYRSGFQDTKEDIKGIMGYNYYNSNGKKSGYSSQGIFGTTNYYGSDGRKKGYSSQGIFGTTNYYGSNGRKKGYSSDGVLGTRNYYNSSGKKTGYSMKDCFGNVTYYGADGKKRGYKSKSWF